MKVEECRVGNYIQFDTHLFTVNAVVIKQLEEGFIQYQPIPLTEEWLLKFGFEKRDDKFYKLMYLIEEGISQFFDNGVSFRITINNSESVHASSVKYVHQLQNLYFALTGKELTLK